MTKTAIEALEWMTENMLNQLKPAYCIAPNDEKINKAISEIKEKSKLVNQALQSPLEPIAAEDLLGDFPCAGMGQKKLEECMRFLNLHQTTIKKMAEHFSNKTQSRILDEKFEQSVKDAALTKEKEND